MSNFIFNGYALRCFGFMVSWFQQNIPSLLAKGETSMKVQKQTSVKNFTTTEGFVGRYQHLIKDVVIPYQYKVLCDEMEGVEKSHVIRNFINAGKALRGEGL